MKAISRILASISLFASLSPVSAFAQDEKLIRLPGISSSPLVYFIVFAIVAVLLARFLMGVVNICFLEQESIASIEKRHPYLPPIKTVTGIAIVTGLLILLSLKTISGIAPFDGQYGWLRLSIVLALFGIIAVLARILWPRESKHYIFGAIIGTIITFILIGFERAIFSPQFNQDPFVMTLGIVCIIIAWRFLFGPWRSRVKAFVLGTFIFWVTVHILFQESSTERMAHLLAGTIALVPAVIWCLLFLGYHRQRLSMVMLMFFSGMLSTAPILLYDKMLRSGLELNFFLFRIVPESFTQTSNAFVSGRIDGMTQYHSTVIATLVSFLLVGLIEELSKYWVLKRSGGSTFTSIDDVIQLGIIVAIGFSFAENVLNPNYFLSFVKDHLVTGSLDWSGFLGNFLGRSILTTMVHIVSTGVLGYYFALSLFTKSTLREEKDSGAQVFVPRFFRAFFRLPEEDVFQREMVIFGMMIAIVLHGVFNFLVTLPSLLPGNPRTIGDLVGAGPDSFLHYIAILIIPSLFYVVGGFWLLSSLFTSKRNMKKRKLVDEHTVPTPRIVAKLHSRT